MMRTIPEKETLTIDFKSDLKKLNDHDLIEAVIGMANTDGISVIVNNDCPINSLTSEQVKEIFMGNAVTWSEISQ